jgi:hypothetical protein
VVQVVRGADGAVDVLIEHALASSLAATPTTLLRRVAAEIERGADELAERLLQ